MAEISLELRNIKKSFTSEETVLNNIDLTIEKGEFITLLGSSGCGKTTTLRIIAGLEQPDEGSVWLDGREVTNLAPNERDVNTVFQNYALFPHMNVVENIGYGLKLKKVPRAEIKKRVNEMLELVQLEGYGKRQPSELSGGQKQRVAIAGVMAMRPQCIILDEPTAMLDPNGRKDVIRTVHELNKKEGITVLLITHYMEEAIDADRVIVMDDGKVIMDGIPKEIFSRVKELKEHGLDVPQATELAFELKEAGMPLTEGILSRQELVEQLTALLSDEK